MNEFPVPLRLVYSLSLSLVITSLLAVQMRRLRASAIAYVVQALLIVALIMCFAVRNHALYWWAATALVTKAILIPWFLFRAVPSADTTEVKPLVGLGPSVVIAALLITGAFKLMHAQFEWIAPAGITLEDVYRTNLGVASTVFMLGLYALLTRRDAIKTVVGLCLLENGVHLSLISLAPSLPETALFGVASEVVVTVYLLLYVIRGVEREFGTRDTLRLRELQW
jgi:hydrogenase-4 component E